MITTKRQPVSVGEMITEEYLVPLDLTQGKLAQVRVIMINDGIKF